MKTIPLTQGMFATVDDRLFDQLNSVGWYAHKNRKAFYAKRTVSINGKSKTIFMHREVFRLLGLPVPKSVDHRDRNGLNNQFDNLRPATRQEQGHNREKRLDNNSGFIGVSWVKRNEIWTACVSIHGKTKHLGHHDTALEAALARDAYVKEHYGEFAVTNESIYLPDAI